MTRQRARRAVIVITRDVGQDKQWNATLEYCATEHLVVEALTRDPNAAITLVEAGFADVVVAATCDERRVLLHTAVPVVLLRQSHGDPHRKLIEEMLARGGDVATVAQLLGLPVRQVEAVAGGDRVVHPRYAPTRQVHVVRRPERVR